MYFPRLQEQLHGFHFVNKQDGLYRSRGSISYTCKCVCAIIATEFDFVNKQDGVEREYCISANRHRGIYLFRCSIWCGDYSRAAFITLDSMTVPRTQHPWLASRQIAVSKVVRKYGSYKIRSRNTQNNNSQWPRFGKCRLQLED